VNRSLYNSANPFLYRNLYLDTPRRFKILSTLASNHSLLNEVRTLTISGGALSVSEFEYMKEVLSGCSNVSSLTYLCFDEWYLPSLTAFVAKTWSTRLRYLRSDSKEGLFELLCRLPYLEELVASRIDFPNTTTSLLDQDDVPRPPHSPSFHLKRFDSGSSPLSSQFALLTRSSRKTLTDLDVPISSQSPLQTLSLFPALSHLTITLAERYLLHNLDSRIGTPWAPTREDRDDVKCLRRVTEMLRRIEEGKGGIASLEKLELYQPDYRRTREISSSDVEEAELLEGIPAFVKALDLSTITLNAEYLLKVFDLEHEEDVGRVAGCRGLDRITLKKIDRAEEVEHVLGKKGIAVEWF
jgi:hypothetical protein